MKRLLLPKSQTGFCFLNSPVELPPVIVGTGGIEPPLSCISDRRSDQLSHVPLFWPLMRHESPQRDSNPYLHTENVATYPFSKMGRQWATGDSNPDLTD